MAFIAAFDRIKSGFAQLDGILDDVEGMQVVYFDPDEGFEAFTVAIHSEITRHGKDGGRL